jgi:hypothetical protein
MSNEAARLLRNDLRKAILARHRDIEALKRRREENVHSVDERAIWDVEAAAAPALVLRAGRRCWDLRKNLLVGGL